MKSPSRRMVNGPRLVGPRTSLTAFGKCLHPANVLPWSACLPPDATTTGIMPYVQFGGRGQRSRGLEEAIPPCGDVPSTEFVCGRRGRSKG
jgi:hypothetical protein